MSPVFGLDERIAALGTGGTFVAVCAVAALLGLRHATDPDHLAAVTTLVAGEDGRGARRLGLAWGAGHATSLVVFGVPIVVSAAYLPAGVQTGAEVGVGVLIIVLALRLLRRWHAGHLTDRGRNTRTRLQAYGIGLVHGMGGSAGVGLLLLAGIPNRAEAIAALALFAACTALSMVMASGWFGALLGRARTPTPAPVQGAMSLAFGVWYALDAAPAVL